MADKNEAGPMIGRLREEIDPVAALLYRAHAKMAKSHKDAKPVEGFDYQKEKDILDALKKPASVADYHRALLNAQRFYYRSRALSDDFRNRCVFLCVEDISHLPALNEEEEYNSRLLTEAQYRDGKLSKGAYDKYMAEPSPWPGAIPAFRFLTTILAEMGEGEVAELVSALKEKYNAIIGG